MFITIRNLTTDLITAYTSSAPSRFNAQHHDRKDGHEFTLKPSLDFTTTFPKQWNRMLVLQHSSASCDNESQPRPSTEPLVDKKEWHIHPEDFKIAFSMTFSASWQVVPVPQSCPWRLFTRRVTLGHHKLLILNRRNMATFLSEMPDRLPLSSLLLPGTHDTMAFHGWPISQCQSLSTPLSTQLHGGVRVLDIRLAVIPPPPPYPTPLNTTRTQELIAYHGLWPQKTPFVSILHDVYTFLSSPIGAKETIVMSIKQEDYAVTPAPLFSQLVRDTIVRGPGGWDEYKLRKAGGGVNKGMWFLENRIPTLGEVRGKVIMLSRFGGNGDEWEEGLEGLGIHPTTWPDSSKSGFEWDLKGTRIRTHDWYAIPSFFSIPEKVSLGTANLIPPSDAAQPVLPITYFSAASFLAFPPTVAKGFGWPKWGLGIEGVNSKLGAWLLDQLGGSPASAKRLKTRNKNKIKAASIDAEKNTEVVEEEPRIRGFALLDYYSEPEGGDLLPLLVECNFRGRTSGEEGW